MASRTVAVRCNRDTYRLVLLEAAHRGITLADALDSLVAKGQRKPPAEASPSVVERVRFGVPPLIEFAGLMGLDYGGSQCQKAHSALEEWARRRSQDLAQGKPLPPVRRE